MLHEPMLISLMLALIFLLVSLTSDFQPSGVSIQMK
jgi:hypothetical protein